MTKRTLIICADSTEAKRLFEAMVYSVPNRIGYTNRLEVVIPVEETAESVLFRTLANLDSIDGYRFDEVEITDLAHRLGTLDEINNAVELRHMLTIHIPREGTK